MILNPWPFNWKVPTETTENSYLKQWCRYSKRRFLLCGADKKRGQTCQECYMRQMAITDEQNKPHKLNGDKVIHICDICGREIGKINNIVYLEPTTRDGTALMSKELCYVCSWQLLKWAGGINDVLPDVPEEDIKYHFRPEEELNVTRLKPKKRQYHKKKKRKNYKGYGKWGERKYSYAHYEGKYLDRFGVNNKKGHEELADVEEKKKEPQTE